MLNKLHLRPGLRLIQRRDEAARNEEPRIVDVDVTARADEFLFDQLALQDGLTLGDVFGLMEACPALKRVFRREFAQELCAEAAKGPLPPTRGNDPEEVGGIEYLELCWNWTLDSSTSVYGNVHLLDFRGVGSVLAVDVPSYGVKAGQRITWSVSMSPVRELLRLPLRFRPEFAVMEDDVDSVDFGRPVVQARCDELTLGQVLQGVLSELSFHGGPEDQAEARDDLFAVKAAVDAGTAKLTPIEDIYELSEQGGETLFETLGGHSYGEVRRAVAEVDDEANVSDFLAQRFDGAVQVKSQFRDRGGRDFRKALRAAGR